MLTFPDANQAHASTAKTPLLRSEGIIMPKEERTFRPAEGGRNGRSVLTSFGYGPPKAYPSIPVMAQPQVHQRLRPLYSYLEQVPEIQPEELLTSSGPNIGSSDPEPVPTNSFPTSDIY